MFNLYSLAVERFSGFALGLCGALLITAAFQAVPTFGQTQPVVAVSTTH
jgi:hypothetical protein